ncbi:glycosyltransferase [Lederbergia lenta]|uniref:Group 1 glycosyl transferase n=1 Tax=Lederbergia lenta TaxID=1467 RepID=A0A2X4WDM0_LEDLE|nr:glycosyltransferase [Lederbergia lenta]MEC2323153.1 glycosyltransferase [Lederbergia lenta]SQI62827.1 group 1 glycosyl transferase [Lederbergia lenta]
MNNNKDKILLLFPHIPNPRMLKRINALKENYKLEVIYWDRGINFDRRNHILPTIKENVILRNANEGNPLKRVGTTIKVMIDALKLIRRAKPMYLYISKTDMLLIGYIYKRFFNNNVEIVYEVSDIHSLMIDEQKIISRKIISKILNKIEKFLCKNIKLLIVTSEYFYKYYYQNFIEAKKTLFIPNTPDPTIFKNLKRKENKRLTIGFIGIVRYAEQIEMLIDAAELTDVEVFIAGKGIDYERVKKYARGKEYVQIYGEYEYDKEIKLLYEKVDCIYSVYNASMKNVQIALPNRLYEAIYTQTPIIVAKDTYLGELVEEYNIGETIQYNDIKDLVEVINSLKDDERKIKGIKNNMSHLSNKWILENFNKELINAIES